MNCSEALKEMLLSAGHTDVTDTVSDAFNTLVVATPSASAAPEPEPMHYADVALQAVAEPIRAPAAPAAPLEEGNEQHGDDNSEPQPQFVLDDEEDSTPQV